MHLEDASTAGDFDNLTINTNNNLSNRVLDNGSNSISILIKNNDATSVNNLSRNNTANSYNQHHKTE